MASPRPHLRIRSTEPTYMPADEWSLYADIPDPTAPCDRIIRFDLIGGGQIKSIEQFGVWPDGIGSKSHLLRTITSFTSRHIAVMSLNAPAATSLAKPARPLRDELLCCGVFPRHRSGNRRPGRRDVPDHRPSGDHFFALLIGGLHCAFCNRPLRDDLSRLIGVGPDCARQHHIPHSQAAAERRLALRRKLLGDVS